MEIVAGILVTVAALSGIGLTLLTLPGTWLTVAAALACELWMPEVFGTWALVAMVVLAVLAEVAEGAWSAVGAAKAGGSRSGAMGSIVGGLLGAVVGTIAIPVPIVGTIVGGVAGAGAGAIVVERGVKDRSWRQSVEIGKGAAVGRLASIIVKTGFAVVIAAVAIVAAWA